MVRRLRAGLIGLAVAAVSLTAVVAAPPAPAEAADGSKWNAGYIISDQLFYNGWSMNAGEVEAFIRSQGGGLADHGDYVPALSATAYCEAIGNGSWLTASQMIASVGAACGISQKVLLVLLQKEQSLITVRNPSATQLRYATGFGCPDDGSGCSNAPQGFFTQVYAAARAFKVYRANPGWYNYRVGWNDILYNPDRACGSSQVYIQNDATAALYIYTPYQPNAAALANLYGTGDGCSAYGNRNFWRLYTDWFGAPTGNEVYGAIKPKYDALGGATGWLGQPTSPQICGYVENGCYQVFQGGNIYTSNAGTFALKPAAGAVWSAYGLWNGPLGYPTSDPPASGDYTQTFQGGAIQVTGGTGSVVLPSDPFAQAVLANWSSLGGRQSAKICGLPDSGCYQIFALGNIYSSATTGVQVVSSAVGRVWSAAGAFSGPLGYPTSSSPASGDFTQTFQGGAIRVTGGIAVLSSATSDPWLKVQAAHQWLGTPAGAKQCGLAGGGCVQEFARGNIYSTTASGIHPVRSELGTVWTAAGGYAGPLGYPTTDAAPSGDYVQTFQGGEITLSGGVARVTAATDVFLAAQARNAWLGATLVVKSCGLPGGGCTQQYQNGSIFSSPSTGAFSMRPEVGAYWNARGRETGLLGYPTSDAAGSGDYVQEFQGGLLMVRSGVVSPADAWAQATWSNRAVLGAAVSGRSCTLPNGGCVQYFQQGNLYSTSATGIHSLRPEVGVLWSQLGAMSGPLGYPKTDAGSGANYVQEFQGGTVTVTGGIAALTAATDPWLVATAANPWLGASTSGKQCGLPNGGCVQYFQQGNVYSSPASGVHALRPVVGAVWSSVGAFNGSLGYPTSDPPASGDYVQTFQGGSITVTGGVARLTGSPVPSDPWAAALAANTWLGSPTSGRICGLPGDACYQVFQNGNIYASAASGVHALRPVVGAVWSSVGAFNGSLGYPTSSPPASGDYVQTFQGGSITVTGGVASITGSTDPWAEALAANTWLGPSKSARICGLPAEGCYQVFQNGNIYASPASGVHSIKPEAGAFWSTQGAFNGALGYPTTDAPASGDYTQQFQGGYVSVVGGVASLSNAWDAAVARNQGWLGAPQSARICSGLPKSGCYQIFQNGNVYAFVVGGVTKAYGLRPEVGAVWSGAGAFNGSLGYPTSDPAATGDYTQTFEGGSIKVTGGVAAIVG